MSFNFFWHQSFGNIFLLQNIWKNFYQNEDFFCEATTLDPHWAAIWAAFGATPGGGGGIEGGEVFENLAPASKAPWKWKQSYELLKGL